MIPSVDYNKWLKLNFMNKQIQIQLKSPKLLCQRKKGYYKTLGTNVSNNAMSPPSLYMCAWERGKHFNLRGNFANKTDRCIKVNFDKGIILHLLHIIDTFTNIL